MSVGYSLVWWRLRFFFKDLRRHFIRNFTWVGFLWVKFSSDDYYVLSMQFAQFSAFEELNALNLRTLAIFAGMALGTGVLAREAIVGGELSSMLESLPLARAPSSLSTLVLAALCCAILFVLPVYALIFYAEKISLVSLADRVFFALAFAQVFLLSMLWTVTVVCLSPARALVSLAMTFCFVLSHTSSPGRLLTFALSCALVWFLPTWRHGDSLDARLKGLVGRLSRRKPEAARSGGSGFFLLRAFLLRHARVSLTVRLIVSVLLIWATWLTASKASTNEQFLACMVFASCWLTYIWSRFFSALHAYHARARDFMMSLPVKAWVLWLREWGAVLPICLTFAFVCLLSAFFASSDLRLDAAFLMAAQPVLMAMLARIGQKENNFVVFASVVATNVFAVAIYKFLVS